MLAQNQQDNSVILTYKLFMQQGLFSPSPRSFSTIYIIYISIHNKYSIKMSTYGIIMSKIKFPPGLYVVFNSRNLVPILTETKHREARLNAREAAAFNSSLIRRI